MPLSLPFWATAAATPLSMSNGVELRSASERAASQDSIGVATREADGTIAVQRRTPPGSGMVGDALVRCTPDDPDYKIVARHIGPMPMGGWVFVRRFPH